MILIATEQSFRVEKDREGEMKEVLCCMISWTSIIQSSGQEVYLDLSIDLKNLFL